MNEDPECYFCRATVSEYDFCMGCRRYVCEACNVSNIGTHSVSHEPIAHLWDIPEDE